MSGMRLRVGIIGTGNVGSTLGKQLLKNKTAQVMYGSRDPRAPKVKQMLLSQQGASVDSVKNTVQWAEAIILATPAAHDDEGIKALAAGLGKQVKGKVLIDATNPTSPPPELEVRWNGKSGGEVLAETLPGTHVFKSFNTLGANMMDAPDGSQLTGTQLTMLYAGPPEAREKAEKVIAGAGFKPEYVGPIRLARNLEAIAELWIHLGVPKLAIGAPHWGRDFHFQVLRKPAVADGVAQAKPASTAADAPKAATDAAKAALPTGSQPSKPATWADMLNPKPASPAGTQPTKPASSAGTQPTKPASDTGTQPTKPASPAGTQPPKPDAADPPAPKTPKDSHTHWWSR